MGTLACVRTTEVASQHLADLAYDEAGAGLPENATDAEVEATLNALALEAARTALPLLVVTGAGRRR